jgi:hypothetical protein
LQAPSSCSSSSRPTRYICVALHCVNAQYDKRVTNSLTLGRRMTALPEVAR